MSGGTCWCGNMKLCHVPYIYMDLFYIVKTVFYLLILETDLFYSNFAFYSLLLVLLFMIN